MRKLTTYLRNTRGAVAVEGAILLPLMAVLGFGIIDVSMLVLQNHKMEQGLVAGAHYLARAENPAALGQQARNIVVTGRPDGSGTARVKGWTANDVTVSFRNVANSGQYRGGANVRIAQLSTDHSYQGLGFIRLASGGSVKIRSNHEERLVRAQ